MMDRLEQAFNNLLFTEPRRGLLMPSPFAERLYNDLKFLDAARENLGAQVMDIRNHGRPVRIGTSTVMFRSNFFRTLFRELQIVDKIRASYIPVAPDEAAKALASGLCDLHIGCTEGDGGRFASHRIGNLDYHIINKVTGNHIHGESPPRTWMVSGNELPPGSLPAELETYIPLDDEKFLHWIDHPADCPDGTRICAPAIPLNRAHWSICENHPVATCGIHIRYLRHHPYEFLPALANGISIQSKPS